MFPKRGTKIIRQADGDRSITIRPPKVQQIPAATPVVTGVAPCQCTAHELRWLRLGNSSALIDDPATPIYSFDRTIDTVYLGALTGINDAAPVSTPYFLAGFVDDNDQTAVICPGEQVTWAYEWAGDFNLAPMVYARPDMPILIVHPGWRYNTPNNNADPNNIVGPLEPGILSVTATACGEAFGPITLTYELTPGYYYY